MKYDFGGYATKTDLQCSDGRVIRKGAFKHCDGITVPLVYQHLHGDAKNVLGHCDLEYRQDGVYAYGVFNDTESGKNARLLVQHGDITALSIYANNLRQSGQDVIHGDIREVSLVLAGANPGAKIDNLSIAHSDGSSEDLDDEAIIHTGLKFSLNAEKSEVAEHADEDFKGGETVAEVFQSMSDKQKNAVYYMISQALGEDDEDDSEAEHSDKGGKDMEYNVFQGAATGATDSTPKLTHAQFSAIITDAQKIGSFQKSLIAHAQEYGIENIEYLFPDVRNLSNTPEFIKRKTEWVSGVLSGVRRTPFSRIRMLQADITADEARAKGYIKGNLKKEEVIKLLKRSVTPCTIYKKQKLDRDDIVDITTMDVVSWLWSEMRMMLEEELARQLMIGDGRDPEDEDKIDNACIIPIYEEAELYATRLILPADATVEEQMEAVLRGMDDYDGSGSPKLYTTQSYITDMLLLKDKIGRRYYNTNSEVASAIGVESLVNVPVMKGVTRTDDSGKKYALKGIAVNLRDYTIGADKGGQIARFEDFDIDYNQYKYLLETRLSGALTKIHSAIIIEQEVTTKPVTPPSGT